MMTLTIPPITPSPALNDLRDQLRLHPRPLESIQPIHTEIEAMRKAGQNALADLHVRQFGIKPPEPWSTPGGTFSIRAMEVSQGVGILKLDHDSLMALLARHATQDAGCCGAPVERDGFVVHRSRWYVIPDVPPHTSRGRGVSMFEERPAVTYRNSPSCDGCDWIEFTSFVGRAGESIGSIVWSSRDAASWAP